MKSVFEEYFLQAKLRKELFNFDFLDQNSRALCSRTASARGVTDDIKNLLVSQNSLRSTAIKLSLDKLSSSRVQFVVTGQQIGLFGGPLMTLFKIVSAIKLALSLETETSVPTIPLFWLQTEDHDFEEIRSSLFQNEKGELLEQSLADNLEGIGDSVGRIRIDTMESRRKIEEIKKFFHLSQDNKTLLSLERSYGEHSTLASSFENFIQELFAEYGLLTFNPDSREAKKVLIPLIRSSIENSSSIDNLLKEHGKWLENRELISQIAIKEGSPLVFFSHEGKRQRFIRGSGDTWHIGSEVVSSKELFHHVEVTPELFTPSALLRPLFQDYLFPTVAYVAGPSEFNYWAQTTPLYRFFSLSQPLVVPRANFRYLSSRELSLFKELASPLEDFSLSFENFLRSSREITQSPLSSLFNSMEETLRVDFQKMTELADREDLHQVKSSIALTKDSMSHNLSRLKEKFLREHGQKQEVLRDRFLRISKRLFPRGIPQERVVNMCSILLLDPERAIPDLLSVINLYELPKTALLTTPH